MGAEAVRTLLEKLEQLCRTERKLFTAAGQKRVRILKRLEVVEAFRASGNRPEWTECDSGHSAGYS